MAYLFCGPGLPASCCSTFAALIENRQSSVPGWWGE